MLNFDFTKIFEFYAKHMNMWSMQMPVLVFTAHNNYSAICEWNEINTASKLSSIGVSLCANVDMLFRVSKKGN